MSQDKRNSPERGKERRRRNALWHEPFAVVGLIMLLVIVVVAILAPVIAPHGYADQNLVDKLQGPSAAYPLGTDQFGRCIFSRVVYGTRITLKVGIMAVVIETLIGVTLGIVAGFYGGVADKVITFLTDMVWSIPPIIFAMAIVLLIGPSAENVAFAVAVVTWAEIAKVVRAKTRTIRAQSFIEAARVYGESDLAILARYILPNLVDTILVMASLSLPSAILSTTSMGFLGLGAQEPLPDWGMILSSGIQFISRAPWITVFPGLALVFTVLAFNLFSEGVGDILNVDVEG